MPRKKEHKEQINKLEFSGYLLYRVMLMVHDEFRNLDTETQKRLSEFVYYLGEKYEPNIEDGYDIEKEELFVKYDLKR